MACFEAQSTGCSQVALQQQAALELRYTTKRGVGRWAPPLVVQAAVSEMMNSSLMCHDSDGLSRTRQSC